jgi:1-acyl-sn-glycerol-3-phosphate acyltransferase
MASSGTQDKHKRPLISLSSSTMKKPQEPQQRRQRVHVRGIVSLLVLTVTSYIGIMTLGLPVIACLLWNTPRSRRVWRIVTGASKQVWFTLVVWWLEAWCGIRFVLTSGTQDGSVPLIKIAASLRSHILLWSNHRSRLDWMYLWASLEEIGLLQEHKIVLKSPLKRIPIFGWGMQALEFLFLSRSAGTGSGGTPAFGDDRAQDSLADLCKTLKRSVQTFDEFNAILVFPEGTDLSDSNREKSQAYARKNKLSEYVDVMHPRTTGTQSIAKLLMTPRVPREVSADAQKNGDDRPLLILDATIAMTAGTKTAGDRDDAPCRPSEMSLLYHDHPRLVHINMDMLTSTGTPEDIASVMCNAFARKETVRFQQEFNVNGSFKGSRVGLDTRARLFKWLRRIVCLLVMSVVVWLFVWLQLKFGTAYVVYQCVVFCVLWLNTEWFGGLQTWLSL